jgi:hypothetical protein
MSPPAIFLSASVPLADRAERYFKTADPLAITAATKALVTVTLGRRLLVWGGHPSITPMIWAAAEDMRVDYGAWVYLFQSKRFQDDFPVENTHFQNVTYVDPVGNDEEKSVEAMRFCMLAQNRFAFTAGVFIGGMEGVEKEFDLFKKHYPNATALPVASTGGAALLLFQTDPGLLPELATSLDYVGLFHRLLGVSPREKRLPGALPTGP